MTSADALIYLVWRQNVERRTDSISTSTSQSKTVRGCGIYVQNRQTNEVLSDSSIMTRDR